MAKVVGVFGMGHAPNLVTTFDKAGAEVCEGVLAGCAEVSRRIKEAGTTTLITVSNDHFNAFSLGNFPTFCVGVGDSWVGPEDDLRQERVVVQGNRPLGLHIARYLLEQAGFDPAMSWHLTLDHGTYVPVRFVTPRFDLPLIPIFQNTVQPPLPTLRRAADFGAALRRAIESAPGDDRVAIIGCGGISHFIGVPNQGSINAAFDSRFLDLIKAGQLESLVGLSRDELLAAGNGAEEIRNWIAAMSAAEAHPAELLFYAPVPAWLIGVGIADFHYASK